LKIRGETVDVSSSLPMTEWSTQPAAVTAMGHAPPKHIGNWNFESGGAQPA
jgi:hypothetical protein